MTYKRVFFDVGATLLKPAKPEGEVFAQIAADFGVDINPKAVQTFVPQMYQLYEQLYEQDDSFWDDSIRAQAIWLEMYEYLCCLLDMPQDKRSQVANVVYKYYFAPGAWDPYPDVIQTLNALDNQGIKMALISNWDDSLIPIIDGLGLSHYFDIIIASATVKMHKPQAQIFQLALKETKSLPADCLHVGDHITADVAGASGVGITPVLLDRLNHHPDANCLRIENLLELVDIINQKD